MVRIKTQEVYSYFVSNKKLLQNVLLLSLTFSSVACMDKFSEIFSMNSKIIQRSTSIQNSDDQSGIVVPNSEKIEESPYEMISNFRNFGIEIGYFGNEIPNCDSEMIFTYPEKFGEFGSEKFLSISESEIKRLAQSNKKVELTLEIFKDTSRNTILEIVSGSLDMKIRKYFEMLAKYPHVIIRPLHEMETTQLRYPWSGKSKNEFIAAWRHLYKINKSIEGSTTKFLWSPAGEENSMDYFPGKDFVDFVGFSLYEYPDEVDIAWYGSSLEFISEFRRKMSMMPTGIPIIIPETGISGDSMVNKSLLLKKLLLEIQEKYRSRIVSITFFNSHETLSGFENISFELTD